MQPTRENHAQRSGQEGVKNAAPAAPSRDRSPTRENREFRERPVNLPTPPLRRRSAAPDGRRPEQAPVRPSEHERGERPSTGSGRPWGSANAPRQDRRQDAQVDGAPRTDRRRADLDGTRTDAAGRDQRTPRRERAPLVSPSGRVGAGSPTIITGDNHNTNNRPTGDVIYGNNTVIHKSPQPLALALIAAALVWGRWG